jgi:hypothetical protein
MSSVAAVVARMRAYIIVDEDNKRNKKMLPRDLQQFSPTLPTRRRRLKDAGYCICDKKTRIFKRRQKTDLSRDQNSLSFDDCRLRYTPTFTHKRHPHCRCTPGIIHGTGNQVSAFGGWISVVSIVIPERVTTICQIVATRSVWQPM